ncbi:MAG: hypothetical protein K6G12_07380 [Lachnospiraceae bacterium]|nr:hypothetical protein [Lachnospiraceae bacterium]
MKKKQIVIALACAMILTACGSTKEDAVETTGTETTEQTAETTDTADTEEKTEETADAGSEASNVISNKLFSLTMPEGYEDVYESEVGDNYINIYHKESKAAGYGGYILGVRAYSDVNEYAGAPISKEGELTAADGTKYDLVRFYESEVQTGYDQEEPADYRELYDQIDSIIATIKSTDGGEFVYKAGCKGEDIYPEVLAKLKSGIEEGWDPSRFEEEGFSSMYGVIADNSDGDALDRIGYKYMDLNSDGIDDMVIGEIAEGDWKGIVYDVFTLVEGKPAHVVSGWDRNRYYVTQTKQLCNEYSGGAGESGWLIYALETGSNELLYQQGMKYDEYTDEKNPYFVSYDYENGEPVWESMTEEDYKDRQSWLLVYDRFDYVPLSQIDGSASGSASTETSSFDGTLPAYTYKGSNPLAGAASEYMITEYSQYFETADVSIPVISIIDSDESDPEDIKVWGDFWIYNYDLEGDTLMTKSGGSFPGLMHIKKDADGNYSVYSMDVVEDGSSYNDSAKKIFGDNYDVFITATSDSEAHTDIRTDTIATYVDDNDLPITQYQDYGWDPVKLD